MRKYRAFLSALLLILAGRAGAQSSCQPLGPVTNAYTSNSAIYAVHLNCMPSACPAGQVPTGIDDRGNAVGCTSIAQSTSSFTSPVTFMSSATFDDAVTFSSAVTFTDLAGVGIISNSTSGFWAVSNPDPAISDGFNRCFGSTFTLTTGNFPLEINLSVQAITAGNDNLYASVLMDGANIDRFENGSTPMIHSGGGTGGMDPSQSFTYQTAEAVPAGTHTFCVALATDGTESQYYCTQPAPSGNTVGPCWLRVKEAK